MSNIKIHHRPDLWHGKYDHSIRIWLHEAACMRSMDRERVKKAIQRRREWGRRMVTTMAGINGKQPGAWRWQSLEIGEQDEARVLAMLDFLLAERREYRKAISGDWVYFYSTDPTFIDDIENLPWLERRTAIQRSQIHLTGTPGTVRLNESHYQYRTYFRGYMRLSDQQEISLAQYLSRATDIRLSPTLETWTRIQSKPYIGDYFFIDHDDLGILTMLSIMVPGIIRRTKPIEIAK